MPITHPSGLPVDYHGTSLLNLTASIIEGEGGKRSCPAPALTQLPVWELRSAHTTVLLLIDGLGQHLLAGHARQLQQWQRTTLTSVFPTSTAPAITTLLTGEPPSRHGVTGWFVNLRELGTIATILPFRPRWGGESFDRADVDPAQLVGAGPLMDRLGVDCAVVMPRAIVHSPYSRAMSGKAQRLAYDTLDECLQTVVALARARGAERRFVYAYWPKLDSLCHAHGSKSKQVAAHIGAIERSLLSTIAELRGSSTLLLVTADHGFTDVPPEGRLNVDDHPQLRECLAMPLTGEPRVAYCHVRAGWGQRFEERFGEAFGDQVSLYSSQSLVDAGWFGPGPYHPSLGARTGDYTAICGPGRILVDRVINSGPFDQLGVHGGISEEELMVPLLVVPCQW